VLGSDKEKEAFLRTLAYYKERLGYKIYAFVLMDNHYHMMIETNEVNDISKVMQVILLSFGSKYRKRHGFIGHLWQGRFQSRILKDEGYVLECLDYIHENPVKAKIVESVEKYEWSSYFKYFGLENKRIDGLIHTDCCRLGDTSPVSARR
jgi:REP element-mobilizing transposase RayT